ncbi:PorT family protein [Hymenobacter sp. DH14]|uniref:PorT family protein n=1 Tax=Hymenobacter cyanobacteriorum TaxID=2926463 RepID=A0A9X1VIR6_9BACT|nr:porin family protein [Hymenobacter cyanobacteriorum]MCI1187745.1 PorT family protein [Hymenobacter cyanobacteriorum]
MKKILYTLALVAGLSSAARAQSDVSLGLKAGASYSNFVGKQTFNEEYIFGFHAGVFANIGLTNLFAFQPEIIYSQKGSNPNITDFKNRLHYVDVPLAFHVNANGLFFEAGPQVGFLVAAQQKVANTSTDIKSGFNAVDFGYLAGLGYQRKTGLGIGLRYNGGITNIPKAYTTGNVTVQNNVRNSAFQLYLTYSFGG